MFDNLLDDAIEAAEREQGFSSEAAPLLPPRDSIRCLGHEALEQNFLTLIDEKKLPHAMIFAGIQGIGKATMAYRLAKYLLANPQSDEDAGGGLFGEALPTAKPENLDVDAENTVCRQIRANAHPDLLVIDRGSDEDGTTSVKRSIDVEQIRKIGSFLSLKPSVDGGWRVVIIDDADTMTRSAQNAVLKNLEEPPAQTVFILVTHRLGILLPTVRSRSRVISFKPLDTDNFETLLKSQHPALTADDTATLYSMTGGSLGQALQYAEEGGLQALTLVVDLLASWPDWDWQTIHNTAGQFALKGQEQKLKAFQSVILWLCDSILRAKAKGHTAPEGLSPQHQDQLSALIQAYSLEAWSKICENLTEHIKTCEDSNLDKKYIIMGCFHIFDQIRREAA